MVTIGITAAEGHLVSLIKRLPCLHGIAGPSIGIFVGHADDETIGFSSVIGNYPDCCVVHVTDSAPDDPTEWKRCRSKDEYAQLRERELRAALHEAGHSGQSLRMLVPDRTAAYDLATLTERVAQIFAQQKTAIVFTHAYEGGHPDHDATAFAVHQAASKRGVTVIEAPFYRKKAGKKKSVWQEFIPLPGVEHIFLGLDSVARELKHRMLQAHRSQSSAVEHVIVSAEFFRTAPAYDFTRPPNDGVLSRNYERAGIDAAKWSTLVREALIALS